jgi:hypothetical protein
MSSAKPKAGVSDSALITLGISLTLLMADSKAMENLYFVEYVIYQSVRQMFAYPNFAVDFI